MATVINIAKLKDFEILRKNFNTQELNVLKQLLSKKPVRNNKEVLSFFEIIGIITKTEKGKYTVNEDFYKKFKGKMK